MSTTEKLKNDIAGSHFFGASALIAAIVLSANAIAGTDSMSLRFILAFLSAIASRVAIGFASRAGAARAILAIEDARAVLQGKEIE